MAYEARLDIVGGFHLLNNSLFSQYITITNRLTGEQLTMSGTSNASGNFQEAVALQFRSINTSTQAIMAARSALETMDLAKINDAIELLDQVIADRTGLDWEDFQKKEVEKLLGGDQ